MRSLLLFAVCAACADGSVSDTPSDTEVAAAPEGPPAIVLRDVDFVSSRGNTVFATGHASVLSYVRETGDGTARDVRLRFPREGSPQGAIEISTPRAQGNPFDEQVSGAGGVAFFNARGDHGATDAARYDGKRGEASGDRPVQLWGPGFTLTSPGFHWHASDDALDLGPAAVVTRP